MHAHHGKQHRHARVPQRAMLLHPAHASGMDVIAAHQTSVPLHILTLRLYKLQTCRSGAVEQLKTHCNRLGVPLFDRGYDKDPTNVAAEAMKQAKRDGIDVVLVDTAGRMQDNEPLMQALSMLINKNRPQLVLFVGEALVGNDGVRLALPCCDGETVLLVGAMVTSTQFLVCCATV
jgi:signal recognition particle GTPase